MISFIKYAAIVAAFALFFLFFVVGCFSTTLHIMTLS